MDEMDRVRQLAASVENFLASQSVILTMGGEPTFIVAQPETPEWSTAAMGPEKLGYARRMAGRLVEQVYPGALAMQVFGKWYPGEPLPRWNFVTLHQTENQPLWSDTDRLLFDDIDGSNTEEEARLLMGTLADQLGHGGAVFPVVEQEDPTRPVGWVLPLDYVEDTWESAAWPYSESGTPILFAGDSPIGLRLPLRDLPEGCSRKALTIEMRRGAIEVFVPPLEWSGFRALIGVLRGIVVELDLRNIVFCGYAPTETGGEILSLGLAADPGVLEVNLPPTET